MEVGALLHVTFHWRDRKGCVRFLSLSLESYYGISESLVSRQVLKLLFKLKVSVLDSFI